MKSLSWFAACLGFTVAIGAGCNGDDRSRDLSLLGANKDAKTHEDERLRNMQLVRVIDVTDPDNPITKEVPASDIVEETLPECSLDVPFGCNFNILLLATTGACRARRLLSTALPQTSELRIGSFIIPVQTAAANVALALQAADFAQGLEADVKEPLDQLLFSGGSDDDIGCALGSGETAFRDTTRVEELTRLYAEFYQIENEAIRVAIDSIAAVADSQLGSSASFDESLARVFSGSALSRAAASHLLVGGDQGIGGDTTHTFCKDRLTPDLQAAIGVFRDAAISPAVLEANGLSIDSLLDGSGSEVPGGSVRQRLGEFYGYAPLLAGRPIEAHFGLTQETFQRARGYLADEINALGRSKTAVLDPRITPSGAPSTFDRFVGTASRPMAPPATLHAAMARFATAHSPADPLAWPGDFETEANDLPDLHPNGMQPQAHFVDAVMSQAASWLGHMTSLPTADIRKRAMAPLALLLSAEERTGRLTITTAGTTSAAVIVNGFDKDAGLLLAVGDDAMRCATMGSIEGAPCKLDSSHAGIAPPPGSPGGSTASRNTVQVLPIDQLSSPAMGFTTAAKGFFGAPALPEGRAYVLRPKPGAARLPGNYESILGITQGAAPAAGGGADAGAPTSGQFTVRSFPITPLLDKRVDELLAPSKKWCALPNANCSGGSFDARMPLDDELATETPGVESSWKHYLNLATQAAERADALGLDYINSGVQVNEELEGKELRVEQQRQRADDEIAKLQDICGTSVDPRKLLKALSPPQVGERIPGFAGENFTDGVVQPDGSCSDERYESIGGLCVVDLEKYPRSATFDPDLQRIADCLDDSNAVTASLGILPLCFWKSSSDPRVICEESPGKFAQPGTKCPVAKPRQKEDQPEPTCASLLSAPPGSTIEETFPLAYFDNTTDHGIEANRCDAIRKIRNDPSKFDELAQDIFTRNWLNTFFLRETADRLDVEFRYDPKSKEKVNPRFLAIMRDGGTRFETGSLVRGPSTQGWPCDINRPNPDPACDCDPNQPFEAGRPKPCSLFCRYGNCSDEATRASFNDLMSRAVTAAKALTVKVADETFKLQVTEVHELLTNGGEIIRAYTDEPVLQHTNAYYVEDRAFALARAGAETANFVTYTHMNHRVASSQFGLGAAAASSNVITVKRRKWMEDALTKKDGLAKITVAYAPNEGSNAINPRNPPPDQPLDGDDVLNALELLCDAAEPPRAISLSTAPVVRSVADLAAVAQYLKLIANDIRERASLSMFFDVPQIALDGLREQSSTGAFPKFAGQYGEQLSTLRGALLRIRESGPLLANEVEQFGHDIDQLRIQIEKAKLQQDLSQLKFASTVSQQLTNCATGFASINIASPTAPLQGVGAAASCANSIAQINFAAGIAELEKRSAMLDSDLAISNFGATFASRSTNLQLQALRLGEAQEDFDRALQARDRLRKEAKASLARAMYLASFQAEHEAETTRVFGNLFDGKRQRYMAALENAKRVSFLAGRAIEQRLGVHLAEMTDDLPLVEAPAKWVGSVCTFTGLSFEDLKKASPNAAASFAGSFISDYVTKLGNVVESYRLKNSFHEGTDTAVISLRDDLMNVRAPCEVPSGNLFYFAGQLDGPKPGWALEGCPTDIVDGVTFPVTDCIKIAHLESNEPSFADPTLSRANGYELTFGTEGGGANRALVQSLNLDAGRYRLSWYTQEGLDQVGDRVGGAAAEVIRSDSPFEIIETSREPSTVAAADGGAGGGWNREFRVFILRKPGIVRVGFATPRKAAPHTTVSAPMLEVLPSDGTAFAPVPFINTSDKLTVSRPACEDRDGDVFRATQWTRSCMRLCSDGFSNDCSAERAQTHCFREASFSVSQRDIQRGQVLNFSGFARGNFNYRIESIGLNFVGTGTRNCDDSELPSTCFGAGFIPYSIEHNGPFFVRNHTGADVEALLFDGRIEHARGLASERYLTNPLSSTDETLMGQYFRTELIGRPLDGNFVIRLWEEPGVDFDAISDVQIALKYRYWTKFQ